MKAVLIVVLALAAIAGVGLLFAYRSFNRQIDNEIGLLLARARPHPLGVVTEAMLAELPAPVRRYLRASGVVGKPVPTVVRLRQTGRIRQDAKSAWMNIEAVEYYSTNPPAFLWKARVPVLGVPVVLGRDRYGDGIGSILMKAASLVTVADAKGPEVSQGALMRYLNEMSWFPAAFLGDNMRWKAIDNSSAEVTLTDSGLTATATLHFDGEGRLSNFVAKRYRVVDHEFSFETWSTPMTAYGAFAGITVPVSGKGIWNLADGDLEYIDLTVTELEYDLAR
jgi:hypothetical protein